MKSINQIFTHLRTYALTAVVLLFLVVANTAFADRGRAEGKIKNLTCIASGSYDCLVIFDALVDVNASSCSSPKSNFRVFLDTEEGKALWNLAILAYTTEKRVMAEGIHDSCDGGGNEILNQIMFID